MMEFIEKQVEKGQQETTRETESTKQPLQRSDSDAPLVIEMKVNKKPKILCNLIKQERSKDGSSTSDESMRMVRDIKREELSEGNTDEEGSSARAVETTKSSRKRKIDEDDDNKQGWLREGLTVKVIAKSLGEKYYKAKGVVQSVEKSCFVGKIKLISPEEVENHVVKMDQEHLETVIPAIGKEVIVLWGKHKGKKGIVHKLHIESYSIDIELRRDGTIVKKLPYEQVCKYVK